MILESFNIENLKIVCAGLPALVDGYFEKETVMSAQGLQAFKPALRFMEDFSGSQEVLDEYKYYLAEGKKVSASRSGYINQQLLDLALEAKEKAIKTRNPGDSEITAFGKKYARMRSLDLRTLNELKKPYQDETERLWQEDIKRFSSGRWQGLDFDKGGDRKKLYLTIFKDWTEKVGFTYDKELSSARKPVFSKHFDEPWKLCFEIDTVYFYRPVATSEVIVNTQGFSYPLKKAGPQFNMSFGLLHDKLKGTSKVPNGQHLFFNLGLFFPIRLPWIEPLMYALFYNLEELGAIINIHLTLYHLMQGEFETALLNGIEEAENSP